VFECDLQDDAYKRLRATLKKLIAPKEDNVRFYFFDEDAVKKIETVGTGGEIVRMQPYYFIGK
jgi:CRISPR/Cas system-associated endoribonuclease Cas2